MGDLQKMNEIEPPEKLTDRQVKIAKEYVNNELNIGDNTQDFCRKHSMSSATLSKWKKQPEFTRYIQSLKGEVISQDELEAYEVVKKHIINRINSNNPTEKEIQLFLDNFDYVVKYQQQKAMQALGINEKGKETSTKTVDEKRQVLLNRLKGDNE